MRYHQNKLKSGVNIFINRIKGSTTMCHTNKAHFYYIYEKIYTTFQFILMISHLCCMIRRMWMNDLRVFVLNFCRPRPYIIRQRTYMQTHMHCIRVVRIVYLLGLMCTPSTSAVTKTCVFCIAIVYCKRRLATGM